ncbi:MAG TPA: integration host factor subunit alpha [Nitrospiraceae bacterium]|jgi:integration host factor subunit alpha
MQKAEIAERIHQEAGISEKRAATLLDWILELLKVTLKHGETIAIFNFGKFTVRTKASRPGRNPRTGERITIAARRVVTFHASPRLKAELNTV